MYDITSINTFVNCNEWLDEIKQNANPDVVLYLVGNQLDLAESEIGGREVPPEDAIAMIEKYKLDGFMETSAKSGENIQEVFHKFAASLVNRFSDQMQGDLTTKPSSFDLRKPTKPSHKKKGCCK